MSYASDTGKPADRFSLERLDDLPKGAWIAIMVVTFIVAWPLGLVVLGYLLWSGKMQSWKHSYRCGRRRHHRARSTGNTAFDDYRAETLKRLEEEQQAFESFVEQLRRAKDQEEFDRFMASRSNNDGAGEGAPHA
ncbi:MAG: DUF2852 domain-containing protein [Alphaproteobacteria bacterium]|mgnify:CR=1 FL=1|nr:hypothetical protein [Rhodobiaceae bacterium]MBO6542207.1 DUF2852 domain-containing protein [Alphaproteobacteria bacterium]MBO6629060.1 DUF2852 domain-containing protein [Alphaproteobacteria bacterium]MDF1624937.1 DUF2852 domain-containing protein [Parvibaculaceae bacterium]|tara:strand:- start:871 stop:1275 length:405 start_codon:yes stop_codon:yes gene_type:complete